MKVVGFGHPEPGTVLSYAGKNLVNDVIGNKNNYPLEREKFFEVIWEEDSAAHTVRVVGWEEYGSRQG
jgi:hypothetical protein